MSRNSRRPDAPTTPALYAMVQTGLEPVAADEITRDLGGQVKKIARGIVVFKLNEITPDVIKLRTTEDVFLLCWGSNSLSYRPTDLDNFRKWTANRPDWNQYFRIHHAIRPKTKGKPTFHLVCQMQGEHAYKRYDAKDALVAGLGGKIPAGWQPADQNAWLEIWLTIRGKTAVCGLRLSDRTMRHRKYKEDHVLASLRPTVAAAMVRLAGPSPGMTLLDPMCGAGTILAETIELSRQRRAGRIEVLGGDNDPNAMFVTSQNLENVGPAHLARWDARRLPLATASVDRIVSNPPFGKQLASLDEVGPLYAAAAAEWNRVLRPGGRAVFLVMEQEALSGPLTANGWKATRQLRVRVLGQPAVLSVWQKPDEPATMPGT
ncbi:methyltransferase domain-containing protein [Fimbriiglobus ruber]|uniref:Putative N6-adenine-specific RNA methylase containing THUMP domain n=1 Tax=Fimbriiglobus ruber TaxID=1908690 RepID=A0A225DM66_9BACT|nr:methyltransferase domain-containing protein [Fimbriiglobus ruber]OWK38576.1 putative N6-adenine-specific RNA methylase containing THUMP domain [Fimbriiglobus ruber]